LSERKAIRRALISVYDKTRLVEIGKALQESGVEILSTGSTCKTLKENGVKVTEVSEYTGFPEIMGGRVKTLHPRIHSGILADQNNPEHLAKIAELDIAPFDLVIINLYPFAATIASGADYAECIEQIDIGGPSMLRGAAKNHGSVAVLSNPTQYDSLLSALKQGGFTLAERNNWQLKFSVPLQNMTQRSRCGWQMMTVSTLGWHTSGSEVAHYVTEKIHINRLPFMAI